MSLCHCVQYHLHPCHPDINAFGRLSFQSLVSFVPNVCPCIAAQPDQASQRKSVPQCPPTHPVSPPHSLDQKKQLPKCTLNISLILLVRERLDLQ